MRLKFIFGIAFFLAMPFIVSSCRYIDEVNKKEIKKNGEAVIVKIEAFQKEKGRLPENEAEMGVKVDEGGPIFYNKKSASSYELSGSIDFDHMYKYNSETKEWKVVYVG